MRHSASPIDPGTLQEQQDQIDATALDQVVYRFRRPAALPAVLQALARIDAQPGPELTHMIEVLLENGLPTAEHPYKVLDYTPRLDPFVKAVMRWSHPEASGRLLMRTCLTASSGELAHDIALDGTVMLVLADQLRELLVLDGIVHVIEDVDPHHDSDALAQAAANTADGLTRAANALGVHDYTVVCASEDVHAKPGRRLRREVRGRTPDRALQEALATAEALNRAHNVRATLGWTKGLHVPIGETYPNDEQVLDREHQKVFASKLIRTYASPGYADDPGRARVSPYAWLPRERRLPLDPLHHGVEVPLVPGMRHHLSLLAARLEVRLGPPPPGLHLMGRITRLRARLAA